MGEHKCWLRYGFLGLSFPSKLQRGLEKYNFEVLWLAHMLSQTVPFRPCLVTHFIVGNLQLYEQARSLGSGLTWWDPSSVRGVRGTFKKPSRPLLVQGRALSLWTAGLSSWHPTPWHISNFE